MNALEEILFLITQDRDIIHVETTIIINLHCVLFVRQEIEALRARILGIFRCL